MTGGKRRPGGRLPAKAALGLAICWTVCALGFGLIAFLGGVEPGWRGTLQVVVAAVGVLVAGCYWLRYAQASRKRG
ncbi:hypothetical protein ABZ342_14605 [Amycolatopsis sp. NPDC005961]|uniref:hypothetical protein n=1 Tax=Amycolatopsis sp. NPDC005961 TaxID=3156720 RepID=UPI0033F6C649